MLNTRNYTGYDNIPAKLLRIVHIELAQPISHLIHCTMGMNIFPETLKCADVSPVFKKDNYLNTKNFRPVSVLTGISKLYESVVNDQLFEFFCMLFNTLRPRQNGRHFADDIFKCIFLNENVWISIEIPLKFVPKGPINNIPALVQIMGWRRPGDKPLSELMMVNLPTHICVFRPQWVNDLISAYRIGYSCQSLLLKYVDNWKTALDRKHFVALLFKDLLKAFDCLPHGLIISKLHAYGVSTPAFELLFTY